VVVRSEIDVDNSGDDGPCCRKLQKKLFRWGPFPFLESNAGLTANVPENNFSFSCARNLPGRIWFCARVLGQKKGEADPVMDDWPPGDRGCGGRHREYEACSEVKLVAAECASISVAARAGNVDCRGSGAGPRRSEIHARFGFGCRGNGQRRRVSGLGSWARASVESRREMWQLSMVPREGS